MTTPVITAAPINTPSQPPQPEPAEPAVRQISLLLTTIVAGAAGCLIAYWTWRMVLRACA